MRNDVKHPLDYKAPNGSESRIFTRHQAIYFVLVFVAYMAWIWASESGHLAGWYWWARIILLFGLVYFAWGVAWLTSKRVKR